MRMQKSAALDTEDERAQWCWGRSRSKLKKYYFEVMFDLPGSGYHTALQLVRDQENPILRIHKVTQWVVRPTPEDPSQDVQADLPWIPDVEDPTSMQWLPACMKPEGQDSCKPEDVLEIKLLDADYITMTPEINVADPHTGKEEPEMGLKIVFPDGTSTEFVGGVYLPRKLMKAALNRAEADYANFSGLGQEAKQLPSGADNWGNEALKSWGKSFKGMSATGALSGALGGAGLGTLLVFGGVPVYSAGYYGTLLMGAGYGMVAGAPAGLGIGAALGAIVGGGAALHDYCKKRRELQLSAVEKMWSKIECHQHFVRCNRTLIVPKGKACPAA